MWPTAGSHCHLHNSATAVRGLEVQPGSSPATPGQCYPEVRTEGWLDGSMVSWSGKDGVLGQAQGCTDEEGRTGLIHEGSSKISGCQEAAAQRSFLADRGAKANGQEK